MFQKIIDWFLRRVLELRLASLASDAQHQAVIEQGRARERLLDEITRLRQKAWEADENEDEESAEEFRQLANNLAAQLEELEFKVHPANIREEAEELPALGSDSLIVAGQIGDAEEEPPKRRKKRAAK